MAAHTHSFLPISTNIKHTSSVKTIRIKKAQTSLAEDDIVLNKTVFLYCNLWSFLHPKSSNHGRPLLHPNRSSPLRQSHKHPPDVIDVAVRDIEKDENADKLLCNLNYNTLTTVTSLSPLPYQQENDWLEPDKEEFQRSGQETGAEITLHVDVVFEFPLIPASRWLQGFTGTIRAYATGEYRKQKVWAGGVQHCYLSCSQEKCLHHILTIVFCWGWLYFLVVWGLADRIKRVFLFPFSSFFFWPY